MTSGTRSGWEVSVTPRLVLSPGKTRYPLYRKLDKPQGLSGQVRKISPPPGFDPRTVYPLSSHYTDWATGPTINTLNIKKFMSFRKVDVRLKILQYVTVFWHDTNITQHHSVDRYSPGSDVLLWNAIWSWFKANLLLCTLISENKTLFIFGHNQQFTRICRQRHNRAFYSTNNTFYIPAMTIK
jgi:hypothetical protein